MAELKFGEGAPKKPVQKAAEKPELKLVPNIKDDEELAKYIEDLFMKNEVEKGDIITFKDRQGKEGRYKVRWIDPQNAMVYGYEESEKGFEGKMVKMKDKEIKGGVKEIFPENSSFYWNKETDTLFEPGDIVKVMTRGQMFEGEIKSFYYDNSTKQLKAMILIGYNKKEKEQIEFAIAKDLKKI
jgi:hypothetical protein